ncbi:UDP-N-acetylmuramoyl-tripeptide--D-alanyl-D-alanine ligase [Alicyclobacillus tolerans]|uniref:UDP-N-acetylmuramoyl-tripeptide--D-alanyl-D- alanine ligase n=1 Tax=Alicyclobacillus tolerans TaxID=90970 RepID=UPI001F26E45B|nr:UDP-N-acetylmuramoyl-tripeptide--D-alanyl-D-alanine ligase [Alicyclobacillus tolerans]MCF8566248.1 UDP-N-acetylmuramoyl-tripeptide--D-alanyl-D-alanine ligase [Alicyclobacillus tolerans]
MAKTLILARPVIAITGSAGKTTTKEMLASILQTRWKIFKSASNLNFINHTATYAKQINASHRAVVLEYGMSARGHIKRHCSIIQPNISIVTNVGSAHIGSFGGDIRKLARAKSELIEFMKPSGVLVLNKDDAGSKLMPRHGFKGKLLTVSTTQPASYRAHNIHYAGGGMSFQVQLKGKTQSFFIPTYGEHQVYNALAAIAVADHLGFSANQMRLGLRRYIRPSRRLTVHRLKNNIVLIDDSFSANPHATIAAVNVLKRIGKGPKIAVLGSMLAMGKYSAKGHRDVGKHVANKKVDYLFTYGSLAKQIGTAAVRAGLPASRVKHFVQRPALHRSLALRLKPNTTVLVKGSHAVGMKETANFIQKFASRRGMRRTS